MPEWLILALLVGCCVWIAWTYTKLWFENKALKEELGDTMEFT